MIAEPRTRSQLRTTPRRGGARETVERLLEPAGVAVDGAQPWDPQVLDERFFGRVLTQGSLGLGDSYVEGWWECARLDELVARLLRAGVDGAGGWREAGAALRARLLNLQSARRAFEVGRRHYDIGNDLYRAHARPPHDLQLRLLAGRGGRPRRGAGGQARSGLPQARPRARRCACSTSAAAGAAWPVSPPSAMASRSSA